MQLCWRHAVLRQTCERFRRQTRRGWATGGLPFLVANVHGLRLPEPSTRFASPCMFNACVSYGHALLSFVHVTLSCGFFGRVFYHFHAHCKLCTRCMACNFMQRVRSICS